MFRRVVISHMKILSYLKDNQISIGVLNGNEIININGIFPDTFTLIKEGNSGLEMIAEYIDRGNVTLDNWHDVEILSPIPEIKRNIICIGWNYLRHFEERFRQDIDLPSKPTVFTKATSSVAGPYESIPSMTDFTKELDYEAELAVVIGKEGKDISAENADEHIFGYMVANDISARDIQREHGGQWFMGKGMDKSCPMGPWIVTKDEIKNKQNLSITCKLNGEVVQSS